MNTGSRRCYINNNEGYFKRDCPKRKKKENDRTMRYLDIKTKSKNFAESNGFLGKTFPFSIGKMWEIKSAPSSPTENRRFSELPPT